MNGELIPFTGLEMAFIGLYLSSLVLIGWLGYRARRTNTLRDFYLAGSGIGFVVLLLTLYATQYSGNTLFGFSGATYRLGYAWAKSIHFMTAIVIFYLLLAPRLHQLAKRHEFVTPTDFLRHRFGSQTLCLIASLVMVVAIANFLIAQLMAMGRALEGLTTFDPVAAYCWGVILLAMVIVVYETLGGFRAVAWTDVIQGGVLLVGFAILLVMVVQKYGPLEDATGRLLRGEIAAEQRQKILAEKSDAPDGKDATKKNAADESSQQDKLAKARAALREKVQPPDANGSRMWLSYILIVGIGGALYPQAIQRIYAARSASTLRRSLAVMAFLPLATALIALLVGIYGAAYIQGLGKSSDALLTVICREIQEASLFGRWLVVVLFAGILAAVMSTADSVLLSISSMVTKDVYGCFIKPDADEAQMTRIGKRVSWVVIAVAVVLTIQLRGTTLIRLLDRKFDLLIQLAPAFFLGIHWRRMRAGPTLWGLLIGLTVALGINLAGHKMLWGLHPGLYGLAINLAVAVIGSLLYDSPQSEREQE